MTGKILPTFVDLEDPVHKIIYDKNLPYEPCKVFTTLPIVLPKDSLKGKNQIVAYLAKSVPDQFKSRSILDLEVFAILTALHSLQRKKVF